MAVDFNSAKGNAQLLARGGEQDGAFDEIFQFADVCRATSTA